MIPHKCHRASSLSPSYTHSGWRPQGWNLLSRVPKQPQEPPGGTPSLLIQQEPACLGSGMHSDWPHLSHMTLPQPITWPLDWNVLTVSVQSQFVAVRLCNLMNHSTPGLPVHHQLPEFIQTHVHLVGDAIQPSHPLSFPSPLAPNPSQHQGLFQ